MTDYKQLCVELLVALEDEASNWNLEPEDHPLVVRARAALSEPEPEGPTDGELVDAYWEGWNECSKRENQAVHAAGLRAVLARWGK
jgi:hypothetical protein